MKTKIFRSTFAAMIAVAGLVLCHSAHASTFTVGGTGNTFKVMRSGDGTNTTETVHYRTVGLSAYAGQHFTAKSGTLTFNPGVTNLSVTVTETSPTVNAYKFQDGTTRSYRFEVLDDYGAQLAYRDRSFTTGTKLSTTYMNRAVTNLLYFSSSGAIQTGSGNKYLDVALSGNSSYKQVTDAGYKQAVHTISTSSLYNNNDTLRTFLKDLECRMYATVYFTQKEEQDGYQYIQILTDNAATYDGNDSDGTVSTPSTSIYKACFILSYDPSGSVMTSDHYQFFPHRYGCADRDAETTAGIDISEFDYDNSHLYLQRFKSNSYKTGTSGSLVLSTTVTNLNVRFDAAGSGGDTWDFKNLKARLALVDSVPPLLLNGELMLSPGRHCYGDYAYISVAFREPVTVTGSPTLSTTWGTFDYVDGSGSNVLTFRGYIGVPDGTVLTVNVLEGTVKDLVGNTGTGFQINRTFGNVAVEVPWSGRGIEADPYIIRTTLQLDYLASRVNANNPYPNVFFKLGNDIAYAYGDSNWDLDWSSGENFTAIGGYNKPFRGVFDGDGHTISGIRISRGGDGSDPLESCQGLFGCIGQGGIVKNVTLADAHILGHIDCGGIAGYVDGGTIQGCIVAWNVNIGNGETVYTLDSTSYNGQGPSDYHGSIAGTLNYGTISQCVSLGHVESRVLIGFFDWYYCIGKNGGLVGRINGGTVTDCLFLDGYLGEEYTDDVIYNEKNGGSVIRCYYRNIRRQWAGGGINDVIDGIYTLTPGTGVVLPARTGGTVLPDGSTIYADGATVNGTDYYAKDAQIALSYTGTVPTGYRFESGYVTRPECSMNGTVLTMTNSDVTVTALFIPFTYSVHFNKNHADAGGTMDDQSFTYDAPQNLSSNTFVRTGYVVYGWSTEAASEAVFAEGARVSNLTNENNAVVNLYAHWTNIAYTVRFDANGGSGSMPDQPLSYDVPQALTSNAFTRAHYAFSGWSYAGAAYADGETVCNLTNETATVTLTAVWTPATAWDGGTGTADNPYLISTCAQLDDLAAYVNANEGSYVSSHYRLMADIAYDSLVPGNFTPIGCDECPFRGSFDGNGHTISGLFVGGVDCQGLFGRVQGAVVKNLTIANCNIYGMSDVGGIVGRNDGGSVENCFVKESYIDCYATGGAIIGKDVNGFLVSNGYHSCNVNLHLLIGNVATNIGTGTVGDILQDNGAVQCSVLSFGVGVEPVTAPQFAFPVYGTTNSFYAVGQEVIVRAPTAGVTIFVSGSAAGTSGAGGTFSFVMPADDVTVSSAVAYIDANGDPQYCTEYTVITNTAEARVEYGRSGATSWYVVGENVTIDGKITFLDSYARLIVCNGATLSATNPDMGDEGIHANGSLSIYCQSGGTGTVFGDGKYAGIFAKNSLTINGGTIIGSGSKYNYGINASSVTLGWTNPSDSISASSYGSTVTVKSGKSFTDGNVIYSGTLNNTQRIAIGGATLRPAFTITYDLARGSVATANPEFFSVASADITLVNPTREGYLFAGWTGTGLDAPAQTVVIAQGSTSNRSYTANWTPDLATYWHADADHDGTSAERAYIITSTIGLNLLTDLVSENAGNHFVLGWTDPADSINVGSYSDDYFSTVNISVNPGQLLTDGTSIYSGTLMGEQIAALAGKTLQPYVSVPYMDPDGVELQCSDFTVITNTAGNVEYGTGGTESWYVVGGNVTIGGQLRFTGSARIILCDGATLAVTNTSGNAIDVAGSLFIYGQANGTGAVTANATGSGIYSASSTAIYGGTVTANATGSNGYGIEAADYIILSWTNPTNSMITASSYESSLSFTMSKPFTDGSAAYSGTLNGEQIAALAGATLRPVFRITLPEGVVASGVVTQDVSTAYALPGASVTLAAVEDFSITNVTVNGSAATDNGNGTYSFTASTAEIAVSATLGVHYVDADGTTQFCSDYTVITNAGLYGTLSATTWYVVTNDVSLSSMLRFRDANAHLILCDGAILAVTSTDNSAIDAHYGNLTIYGQPNGIGAIDASGAFNGIEASGNIAIHAGVITANGGDYGIYAKNITLGWTNPSDSITASSYDGTVAVKPGQALTDDANHYGGSLTSEQISAIAGKTLRPSTLWKFLQAQLNAGGTVTLSEDVSAMADDVSLTVTNAVTLDLNGHTIDANGKFRVITIASGGNLTLTNSVEGAGAITGGTATYGGGVYVSGNSTFTMTGGAIFGNTANFGGGVYMDEHSAFTMTGGSISGNTASGYGGGVYMSGSTFTVSSSPVVSGNTNSVGAVNNVYLPSGHMIAVDGLSTGTFLGVTTDATPTASSPVTFATGASAGDKAYFFSDVSGFIVEGVNDALRLRPIRPWEQLQAQLNVGGTVTLTNDVSATNGDAPLFVTNAVILDLNGHTITHNGNGQVLSVENGGDLTLTNSLAAGAVTGGGDHGVYVGHNAVFRLQGGMIAGNMSNYAGGGVFVDEYGTFEMSGGSITNNAVHSGLKSGGGVYLVGNGTFTLSGGEISGNTVDDYGGGVYVSSGGTFTMNGGEISGNTASTDGGGVYQRGGTFAMNGGEISDNTATYGGGVYQYGGSFPMNGGEISGNTANTNGGGVYQSGGTFTVSGSPVVSNNTKSGGAANNVYLYSGKTITVSGLSAGASIGVTTDNTPTESSPVTFATGALDGDEEYFFSDDSGCHVERDGSNLRLVLGAIPDGFKDPQGAVIEDSGVVDWLSNNGFTQADIDALGNNDAATDKLYECFLLNCDFTAQDAGGALNLTGIAVSNGVVSVTVQLTRKAPLGFIIGHLYLYGTDDLAAGFGISPIDDVSINFGTDDPTFATAKSTDSVTQTATATFDVSVVSDKDAPYRFFKAVIRPIIPNEPEPEPEPEPDPEE